MEKTEFEFPDEAEDKNPRAGGKVVEPEEEIEIVLGLFVAVTT